MWLADTTWLKEALSMTPIYLRFTGNVHDYKVCRLLLLLLLLVAAHLPALHTQRARLQVGLEGQDVLKQL